MGTPEARWVLAATVLGSGVAFLDGTIVNVAAPAIAEDLDATISDLQWVLDAYLVALTALLLLGGALGDRYGRRRVFLVGLGVFTASSAACGVAPNVATLIAARGLQGVGAALLVPGSLAIISGVFDEDDRARAVGAWSGLTGVSSAVGPFLGGWLIDAVSWRLAFLVNLPFAAAVVVAARHVPETRDELTVDAGGREVPGGDVPGGGLDVPGAVLATLGLALGAYGLIEQRPPFAVAGVVVLVVFAVTEARRRSPMLPLTLFRDAQFSGANATTLAVYAALGGAFFLLVLELQLALGYSALEAGAALIPVTVLLLVLSSRAGALAQRIGPRLPMTVGPLLVAGGLLLWTRVDVGSTYLGSVLPGALVFGLGLALTVAPLTATIMAAAHGRHLGAASGVNNAIARLAGLLAVAVLPVAVGIDAHDVGGSSIDAGVDRAMVVSAVLAALGGVIALLTVRRAQPVSTPSQALTAEPCLHPCIERERDAPKHAA